MHLNRYSLLLLLCIISIGLKAQQSNTLWDNRLKMFVYDFVEKPPTFPGGEIAMVEFLGKIKYPKDQEDLQSSLMLSFVVDTAGNILDKCILNKREQDYSLLDREGMSVLNGMPKWIPGELNGRKVAVWFNLPIRICLQE